MSKDNEKKPTLKEREREAVWAKIKDPANPLNMSKSEFRNTSRKILDLLFEAGYKCGRKDAQEHAPAKAAPAKAAAPKAAEAKPKAATAKPAKKCKSGCGRDCEKERTECRTCRKSRAKTTKPAEAAQPSAPPVPEAAVDVPAVKDPPIVPALVI